MVTHHDEMPAGAALTGPHGSAVLSRSEPPAAGHERRWAVLAVLCLALLIVGIDGTIVNVALPHLVRDLGASASQLQWIVDAYTILFAGFLLIAGNSGDRLGRKRCFIVGLVIFGAGSLACSRVSSSEPLILLRGVQGFGAAFVMPATLSILANVFTDASERARAIALWAGVSGLGVALGPLAGGFLLEHFEWGAIFLVNVPIVIVTVVAAVLVVPESRDEEAPRLDLLGTLLSTAGLITLLYGIIEGPTRGWNDGLIVGSLVAAVVLVGAFVAWEVHTDHPILDVRLFANARFSAASAAITLVFFALFGTLFFVSQYLQFVLGLSALQSGLGLLPVAATLMVAAPLSARLVTIFGTKAVVAVGLTFVVIALAMFSTTTVDSTYTHIAAVLVVVGIGLGCAMAPATDSIMGSLPPEKAGVGSAMNDTTREIGGALGVAILGSITNAVYRGRIVGEPWFGQLEQAAPEAARAVQESVGSADIVATQLPAAIGEAIARQANDAFVHGITQATLVGAAVAAVGVVVTLLFLPARARADTVAPEGLDELVDGAARHLVDADDHDLSGPVFEALADAGLSSLTFNGIAARAGIPTATLDRIRTARIVAATGALQELVEAHPVPDTGDLRADLRTYLRDLSRSLATPRARQVLGALITEAAVDPELGESLRIRVLDPRRVELAQRVSRSRELDRTLSDVEIDQLFGPVVFRAVIGGLPVDDDVAARIVSRVLPVRSRV